MNITQTRRDRTIAARIARGLAVNPDKVVSVNRHARQSSVAIAHTPDGCQRIHSSHATRDGLAHATTARTAYETSAERRAIQSSVLLRDGVTDNARRDVADLLVRVSATRGDACVPGMSPVVTALYLRRIKQR